MKTIYKGQLNSLTVKNLKIRGDVVDSFDFEKAVISEDILFYTGAFGTLISFDYNTRLPDENEARGYILYGLEQMHEPEHAMKQCTYVDIDTVKPYKQVSNREFRLMKKAYAEQRKQKRK